MENIKKNISMLNMQGMGKAFKDNGLILFLIVICIAFAAVEPRFLSAGNIMNVMIQVSINALLATGMTFVLITGGIDVSVGSVAALAGVVATFITRSFTDISIFGAIFIQISVTLGIGILFGGIVALSVAKLKVAPFIATLAMASIARGAGYIITGGKPIFELPVSYTFLGQSKIGGTVPFLVILMMLLMLLSYIILSKLPVGRHIYSVGSNENVAYLSGISPIRIKILVYMISSTMAALGGIALSSKLGTGQPAAATGYELTAIASVVMGGTSLSGGKGGIGRTVVGVLTIGIINNGLNLLQISSYWQQVVMGTIIFIAVILDQNKNK